MRYTINNVLKSITDRGGKRESMLIGIDGHGGSGKSLLARKMAETDSGICLVHFDDFYCPHIKNHLGDDHLPQFDVERLERELLIPLSQNESTRYQKYNWELHELDDWSEVHAGNIVIVEGVYSLNTRLQKYYDYKIWVDCPLEIRLNRAKARDAEYKTDTMELWLKDWIPRENHYVLSQKPYHSADLIIDGSGQNADIECGEIHTLNQNMIGTSY